MARMQAVVWDGRPYPHGLQWSPVDQPAPPPGWVLVRNHVTGICGSDLHYLSGAMRHQVPERNLPAVLGHENAGEIVELGAGVTGWQVGDRVALEPLHPCRTLGVDLCPACMAGQYHRCQHLSFVGIPANRLLSGGYGEFSIYHASCLFSLPDHVTCEEAALLDVLACGVHAVHVGQPSPGDAVAVLGCGPIGLCALQALRAIGVRDLIAVAKHPFQAEAARALGAGAVVCLAETPDAVAEVRRLLGAADQVYECVGGAADTVQQGLELCRRGGKVIVEGFFTATRPVNLEKLFLDELSIVAADGYSTWGNQREFAIALDLVANRQVDLSSLITHTCRREDWHQALAVAFDRGASRALKVVFAG